jgi:hypothetical protein
MKRLLLLLLLLTGFQGFSQTRGISYQAVILSPSDQELPGENAAGNILANTAVSIQFTIVNASAGEEFKEYHRTSTDGYGMINLLIGTGTNTGSSNFTDIVWDGTLKKLKVEIDFSGGTNFSPLSEQNLTYMPQPINDQTAQVIAGLIVDQSILKQEVSEIELLRGEQGEAGPQGIQGEVGPQGLKGDKGDTGAQGIQGEIGSQGIKGEAGPQGIQGEVGLQGNTGAQGIQGIKGDQGIQGDKGDTGAQGVQGLTGDQGDTGAQGIQGEVGPQGNTGAQGAQGIKGDQGIQGDKGDTGAQGIQGLKGDQGDTGAQGIQGLKGDKGDTGAQGIQGIAGPKGDTGAQGIQGLKGDQGDTGAQGIQGIKGDQGIQGETGATGPMGPQGPAGLAGADGVDGLEGATGPMGPQGPAGLNGATGMMGPPGLDGADGIDGRYGADGVDGLTTSVNGVAQVNGEITLTTTNVPEGDNKYFTDALVSMNADVVANTVKVGVTPGTQAGDMQYWNGTAWVVVATTVNEGATLQMIGGVPTWTGGTPPPVVGDLRYGGIVFWVDPNDNTHGLVCALQDQSAGIQWYNGDYKTTGATATAIGTGSANTNTIISEQGQTQTAYAAGLAIAYRGGGYTDWFLPSKDELNIMFINRATINSTATANSGSNFSTYYWSSTEYDKDNAWGHGFTNDYRYFFVKDATLIVRAVRAF